MVVAVVDCILGGETASVPDFCGDLNPVARAKKAQGGNTAHAPVWFAGKLAAHDSGGGGQLRADAPGACAWYEKYASMALSHSSRRDTAPGVV
jgi:hypothetical protein